MRSLCASALPMTPASAVTGSARAFSSPVSRGVIPSSGRHIASTTGDVEGGGVERVGPSHDGKREQRAPAGVWKGQDGHIDSAVALKAVTDGGVIHLHARPPLGRQLLGIEGAD